MLEKIIILLGILYFTDALFVKWNIWSKLEMITMKSPVKFFFDLITCRLCSIFHLSSILTITMAIVFFGFTWDLIWINFVVVGLFKIVDRDGL